MSNQDATNAVGQDHVSNMLDDRVNVDDASMQYASNSHTQTSSTSASHGDSQVQGGQGAANDFDESEESEDSEESDDDTRSLRQSARSSFSLPGTTRFAWGILAVNPDQRTVSRVLSRLFSDGFDLAHIIVFHCDGVRRIVLEGPGGRLRCIFESFSMDALKALFSSSAIQLLPRLTVTREMHPSIAQCVLTAPLAKLAELVVVCARSSVPAEWDVLLTKVDRAPRIPVQTRTLTSRIPPAVNAPGLPTPSASAATVARPVVPVNALISFCRLRRFPFALRMQGVDSQDGWEAALRLAAGRRVLSITRDG